MLNKNQWITRTVIAGAITGGALLVPALVAQTQTDPGSGKMMKSPDVMFATKAAQGGLAEVQMGKLAADKATNPDVKAFGQKMVDDHTKANDNLKSIAADEKMTLPDSLNPKDQALYTKLQNAPAGKFDHEYVMAMVKDHQMDVKEFQKEATSGQDPKVKGFASDTLPVIQMHLDHIKTIASSMPKK